MAGILVGTPPSLHRSAARTSCLCFDCWSCKTLSRRDSVVGAWVQGRDREGVVPRSVRDGCFAGWRRSSRCSAECSAVQPTPSTTELQTRHPAVCVCARVHVFTQALIVRVQLCVCRLVLVAALPLPHRLQ